jgi:hypothetical protein
VDDCDKDDKDWRETGWRGNGASGRAKVCIGLNYSRF